jgi:hypothetical protein
MGPSSFRARSTWTSGLAGGQRLQGAAHGIGLCRDGVDVASVGPLFAELAPGGAQYSVVVIVPERGGKDFAPYYVDIAEDPFMATVYRTGRSRVGRVFGRMQIFGTIRAAVCGRMAWLGLELDRAANCANGPLISTRASKVRGTG